MEIYKIYRKFKVNKFLAYLRSKCEKTIHILQFFSNFILIKNEPKFSLNRNFVDIVLLQNIYQGVI